MRLPVWKVTRTAAGRRLFELLADRGVVLARLEQFERTLERPPPERPVPDEVDLAVARPTALPLAGRMARPELTERDRVVAAVAGDRVVGVQPITTDRPFHVAPLDRTVEFDGAYFWGLYVAADWRRRGVATALVARALSYVADRTGLAHVHALVGADNVPSKRVLRGAGFERSMVRSYVRLFGFERRRRREVDGAAPARAR